MKSVAEEIGYTVEYIAHIMIRIRDVPTPQLFSDITSLMFYDAAKNAISDTLANILRWLCTNSQNPDYNTKVISAFVNKDAGAIGQLLNQDVRTVINRCTGFVDCHGDMIYANDTVVQHYAGAHVYSKVVFENGAYGIRQIGEDHADDKPEYFCNMESGYIEKYFTIVK